MKCQSEAWMLFFSVSAQMFLIWTFCRPDVLWAELVWGGWCHRWACSLLQQWHHWCIPQTLPLSLLCFFSSAPPDSSMMEVLLVLSRFNSHNPTQTSQLHVVCVVNSWCYVVHIVHIVYIICFIHVVYVVWSLYNFRSYSLYRISCM